MPATVLRLMPSSASGRYLKFIAAAQPPPVAIRLSRFTANPFVTHEWPRRSWRHLWLIALPWTGSGRLILYLAELGIAHHVADKVLNHSSGQISGVAAVYNRFQYLDERKSALDALSRFIDTLIGRDPGNVVPIRA